jgi:hypothetical protein
MDTLAKNSTENKMLKKLSKPNSVIVVPSGKDFFKWWCVFLRPFVSLTNREIDIVANLLEQRYKLSKVISDPAVLDSQLMSQNTINKVLEDCNITIQHLYVVMSNLRKKKVITDTGIDPRLIPTFRKDDNGLFQLLILFKGLSLDN